MTTPTYIILMITSVIGHAIPPRKARLHWACEKICTCFPLPCNFPSYLFIVIHSYFILSEISFRSSYRNPRQDLMVSGIRYVMISFVSETTRLCLRREEKWPRRVSAARGTRHSGMHDLGPCATNKVIQQSERAVDSTEPSRQTRLVFIH